jgi:hypothetical protein
MSATVKDFDKQKELTNKKASKLEDHEKIYLMKKEIDNLRNVIRKQNGGSLKSATTSATSTATSLLSTSSSSSVFGSSFAKAPVLGMFLVVGVLFVAVWRKRRQSFRFSRLVSSRTNENPEYSMTFEMHDAHDYEAPTAAFRAAESSANVQFV